MLYVGFSFVFGEIPELAISDRVSLASTLVHPGGDFCFFVSWTLYCLCDILVIFLPSMEQEKGTYSWWKSFKF